MNQQEQKTKLCILRDIFRAIRECEMNFQEKYDLCLNEGMALCSLSKKGKITSSELAECLGLTNSNTSKVIRSIEEKGLISRIMGKTDKRNMYFKISKAGIQKLEEMNEAEPEIDTVLSFIYDTKKEQTISVL